MTDERERLVALLELMQHQSERIGEEFRDPEEDWWPTAIAMTDTDKMDVMFLDPGFFDGTAEGKDRLVEILVQKIREDGVTTFAFAVSAWHLTIRPEDYDPRDPTFHDLSVHPDRREGLMVHAFNAAEHIFSMAYIERSDTDPPRLSEWDTRDDAGAKAHGRFIEPFREALKAVQESEEA